MGDILNMRQQALANQYFNEYKANIIMHNKEFKLEHNRWLSADDTILDMTLEKQAEYADYVTKKMCGESIEIIEAFAKSAIDPLKIYIKTNMKVDSSVVGSVACMIIALPPGDTKTILHTLFDDYITVMSR